MRSGSTCKGGDTVSKRKNGTLRAGARLGLNPYSWGNGRGQAMQAIKRPAGGNRSGPQEKISQFYFSDLRRISQW